MENNNSFWIFALFIVGSLVFNNMSTSRNPTMSSEEDTGGLETVSDSVSFVQVKMPDNTRGNMVYVFAPPSCSSDAGQRTDHMVAELKKAGIPVERRSEYAISGPVLTFRGDGDTARLQRIQEEVEREMQKTSDLFSKEPPVVLFNGLGKANPSVDHVISIYRQTRS